MDIVGTPTKARQLMDDLELWRDGKVAPDKVWREWADMYRNGAATVPPKVGVMVQKAYDAYRRADMDDTLRVANEAHRAISTDVKQRTFNKDYSGALQHLGQFVFMGTEKREHVFNPRRKDEGQQVAPNFFIMPPPERRSLPDANTVEGEVVGR